MLKWTRHIRRSDEHKIPIWEVCSKKTGFWAAYTTRSNGYSSGPYASFNLSYDAGEPERIVAANRSILINALPHQLPEKLQLLRQIHSADVIKVDDAPLGAKTSHGFWLGPRADALITDSSEIILGMLFADCLPIYIIDTCGPIALVHGGWRCLTGGIIQNTLTRMKEHWNTEPSNCFVIFGPCIDRSAYEVDETVLKPLRMQHSWWREVVYPSRPGRAKLDLAGYAKQILLDSGVFQNQIATHPLDTYYHSEEFYSHRRDEGTTGRCVGLLALTVQ